MAKVVYEKRDRIGYVTVNGYSSVGDFREVAERLQKFFGK